jgi:hypothetical protein
LTASTGGFDRVDRALGLDRVAPSSQEKLNGRSEARAIRFTPC